jgi:hypothetical protein
MPAASVAEHPIFPTNSYGIDQYDVFATKGIPYRKVPQLPRWFDELRDISNRAGLQPGVALEQQSFQQQPTAQQQQQPRTATYSKTTGRLNEAPSRAMSRSSRAGKPASRSGVFTGGINKAPDNEALVMELLSQILQTDSISAIQQWLVNANDREKDLVGDMIRAALSTEAQLQGYEQELPQGQIGQDGAQYDRLVVEQNNMAAPTEPQTTRLPEINNGRASSRLLNQLTGQENTQRQQFHVEPTIDENEEYVEYRNLSGGQQ